MGGQREGGEGPPHSPASASATPSPERLPSAAMQLPGPGLQGTPEPAKQCLKAPALQVLPPEGRGSGVCPDSKGHHDPFMARKEGRATGLGLVRRILRDEHRPERAQVRQATQPSPHPQPSLSTPALSPPSPHTHCAPTPDTFARPHLCPRGLWSQSWVPFWPRRALALAPAAGTGRQGRGEALCHLAKGRQKRLTHHSGEKALPLVLLEAEP